MKYLCLIYYDEKQEAAMSDAEWDALMGECEAYGERLAAAGRYIAGEPLQPVRTAATVRRHDGQVSVTDGPFAETKEQLAGFYLVDARDLNEAIHIAGKIPPGRLGSIEVRPVRDWPPKRSAGPLSIEAHADRPEDAGAIRRTGSRHA